MSLRKVIGNSDNYFPRPTGSPLLDFSNILRPFRTLEDLQNTRSDKFTLFVSEYLLYITSHYASTHYYTQDLLNTNLYYANTKNTEYELNSRIATDPKFNYVMSVIESAFYKDNRNSFGSEYIDISLPSHNIYELADRLYQTLP